MRTGSGGVGNNLLIDNGKFLLELLMNPQTAHFSAALVPNIKHKAIILLPNLYPNTYMAIH